MNVDDDGALRRISARLRIALVADLVVRAPTTEVGNRYFLEHNDTSYDWTGHVARQLDLEGPRYLGADLRDTLLVIVGELDRVVQTAGALRDPSEPAAIAHEAVKHLSAIETLTMLNMGPSSWMRGQVPGCKVENLPKHLHPILERGLTSSIGGMLGRWDRWDVIGLRDRFEDAVRHEQDQQRRAPSPTRPTTPARRKRVPPPPPLTPEQIVERDAIAARNKGKVLGIPDPPWESSR